MEGGVALDGGSARNHGRTPSLAVPVRAQRAGELSSDARTRVGADGQSIREAVACEAKVNVFPKTRFGSGLPGRRGRYAQPVGRSDPWVLEGAAEEGAWNLWVPEGATEEGYVGPVSSRSRH